MEPKSVWNLKSPPSAGVRSRAQTPFDQGRVRRRQPLSQFSKGVRYKPMIVQAYYRQCGLPEVTFEHRIIPNRKYAWDICFVKEKIWIEVQGGLFRPRGAHNTGKALLRDYEKHNLATKAGWLGLYVTSSEVCMQSTVISLRILIHLRHSN